MNQETYILIGICVFCLLLGNRLKKWFGKKNEAKIQPVLNKNQRPKAAKQEYPTGRYRNREKAKRIFTYIVIVVLFLLVLLMMPALVRDVMLIGKYGMSQNLFLRLLIVVFGMLTLVSAYLKVRKHKKD